MSIQQVPLHVPGDDQAVINCMNKHKIEYHKRHNEIFVKNCCIHMEPVGAQSSALVFETSKAKERQGQDVTEPRAFGDKYLPFREQQRIFDRLKSAILDHRKEFFKATERRMQRERKEKEAALRLMHGVIDFEQGVIREEHQLEAQIRRTMQFLHKLEPSFPKSAFNYPGKPIFCPLHCHIFDDPINRLHDILKYLILEEAESVHLLADAQKPIEIRQMGKEIRGQKRHLGRLTAKLNGFVKAIQSALKKDGDIDKLQITSAMREHLKEYYRQILRLFKWYADLFKDESRK